LSAYLELWTGYSDIMKDKLKSYFILGLITLLPLALTITATFSLFMWMDSLVVPLFPSGFRAFPGFGILISLIVILLIGALAKTVLGKVANSWTDALFLKVPIARSIYRISKQIAAALFSTDSKSSFKQVVRVPFPSDNTRSLGFVTHTSPDGLEVYVFVPTAPNPTSGYVLIYKADLIEDAGMSVNQALQIILSCGSTVERAKNG
jgi:uncharacterized membrane protein